MEKPSDIFIAFIINGRYVRWETFPPHAALQDIHQVLQNKYKIYGCVIEVNNIVLSNSYTNEKLLHLCKDRMGTIYVTTKNKKYNLCKHIF